VIAARQGGAVGFPVHPGPPDNTLLLALAVPADPFTAGGAACLFGLDDAEQPAQKWPPLGV